MKHSALVGTFCLATLLASSIAQAKTLVFCSEGSPENFYPAVNTTGTSFDANSQIYSRIVDFERGTTKVVPGLAERWDISPDGSQTAIPNHDPRHARIRLVPLDARAGTAEKTVTIQGLKNLSGVVWAADGRGWYVAVQSGTRGACFMSISKDESSRT